MMKRIIIALVIVAGFSQAQAATDTETLFRAMDHELQRSMSELKIGDLPRPYNLEYVLTKRSRVGAHATLGIVSDLDTAESVVLTVRIRVGAPKFDNTNFFDVSLGFFGSSDDEEQFKSRRVPKDLTYDGLRRELWLATDACYKQAVELYAKKAAVIKNKTRQDTTWDFSYLLAEDLQDESAKYITVSPMDVVKRVEEVSSVFRDAPYIQASRVGMEFVPEEILYVNSEGRRYHKFECFTGFEIAAVTQAADGMPLTQTFTSYAIDPDDLPSTDSLKRAARAMSASIKAAMSAETIEPYSGPVLFQGQAAAQVIAQQFAPNVVAQRKPLSEGGFSTGSQSMKFQNKIGARVLPEFLSLADKPSLNQYEGTPIAAHYTIDDEGVAAEDVNLVEQGYLKTMLSSRVPTRRVKRQTGINAVAAQCSVRCNSLAMMTTGSRTTRK